MIQFIGIIWETMMAALSWLPPFCQTALVAAGSVLAAVALINLTIKAAQAIKG